MKVTKNILREIIESEMKLLNEAVENTGFLNLRGATNTVKKLGKLLRKYKAATDDSPQQDRRMQRFERLWNAIKGGIMLSDLMVNDVPTELGEIVYEAAQTGTPPLISAAQIALIDGGRTATDRADPDVDRTAAQMAATLAEIEEEETADDSASEETAASATGTTTGAGGTLTAQEQAMLTAIATQGGRVLKRGSKSPKVGLLQSVLKKRLEGDGDAITALGEPDNDFGPKTKAAVEELQRAYSIGVDGKVGKNTAASLLAGAAATGSRPSGGSSSGGGGGGGGGGGSSAGNDEAAQPTQPAGYPGFSFDSRLEAWYNNTSHKYDHVYYDIWIMKDGVDYHTNDELAKWELTDFTSQTDEAKSLPERLGMLLTEVDFVIGDSTNDSDTLASELLGSSDSDPEEAAGGEVASADGEGAGEEDADEEAEATDSVNVGRLAEIVALLEVTDFGEWTEPEFVRGFEDWIVNGFGDNNFRNEFSYLSAQFEEKLDRMLNYDFSGGYGGNLTDFEKENFKETIGATSLSNLKPGKLTKDALTRQLTQTETSYSNSRVEDAWNKFIGTEGAYYGHASLRTTLKLRKSADDESGTSFVYTGPDEFIILLAAMKKLRRMIGNLTGFSEASEPEGVSESLSYDRFQKLAGLLKG